MTVLDHDGLKFNLNPTQRRAVLETIFSETSQAVTDLMISEVRSVTKDVGNNYEKGIPSAATSSAAKDGNTHVDDSIDLEEGNVSGTSPDSTLEFENPRAPDVDTTNEDGRSEDMPTDAPLSSIDLEAKESDTVSPGSAGELEDPLATTQGPKHSQSLIDLEANGSDTSPADIENPDAAAEDRLECSQDIPAVTSLSSESTEEGVSTKDAAAPPKLCPSSPTLKFKDDSIDLAMGNLGEKYEEEEGLTKSELAPSIECAQAVSFPHGESEHSDDESEQADEEEYLCAICLSDYETGEVIITSKYCSHLYHRDCILAWLEKNNDCPCCRVVMMTDGEMTKAAKGVVGTRMTRVVRSLKGAMTSPVPIQGPSQDQPGGGISLAHTPMLQWHHKE